MDLQLSKFAITQYIKTKVNNIFDLLRYLVLVLEQFTKGFGHILVLSFIITLRLGEGGLKYLRPDLNMAAMSCFSHFKT